MINLKRKMQFLKNNLTFLHRIVCVYVKNLVSLKIALVIVKVYENPNFIT